MESMTEAADDGPTISEQMTPSIARYFRMQFESAQDSWVLLFPEGMIKLNQSAAQILQRCDGKRDVAAIVSDLETTFNESGLTNDVKSFLQIAHKQGWVQLG